MKDDIIYLTRDMHSPCSQAVVLRKEIKIVDANGDYVPAIENACAAIVDADEDRQEVIKALLKEKIPFALCGLVGETPDSLKRLYAAAKRRHIQLCWLGAWRYEWAMARLKETITSGVLGTLQQYKITKPEGMGVFERLRDEDLMNWLSAYGNDASHYLVETTEPGYHMTVTGTRGSATASILDGGKNQFVLSLCDAQQRVEEHICNPLEAEVGYLLFVIRTGRPWTMLGRIPN